VRTVVRRLQALAELNLLIVIHSNYAQIRVIPDKVRCQAITIMDGKRAAGWQGATCAVPRSVLNVSIESLLLSHMTMATARATLMNRSIAAKTASPSKPRSVKDLLTNAMADAQDWEVSYTKSVERRAAAMSQPHEGSTLPPWTSYSHLSPCLRLPRLKAATAALSGWPW